MHQLRCNTRFTGPLPPRKSFARRVADLPPDLPVVEACKILAMRCFSADEQYLACLLECVLRRRRLVLSEILAAKRSGVFAGTNPSLTSRIAQCQRRDQEGKLCWEAEHERVRNVIVKLARGHLAYEFGLPLRGEPDVVSYVPFVVMPKDQVSEFEAPEGNSRILWPEIGSRALVRACITSEGQISSNWIIVQAAPVNGIWSANLEATLRIRCQASTLASSCVVVNKDQAPRSPVRLEIGRHFVVCVIGNRKVAGEINLHSVGLRELYRWADVQEFLLMRCEVCPRLSPTPC